MTMLLRHALSIAILPFTASVVVPVWIALLYGIAPRVGPSFFALAWQGLGVIAGGVGMALFATTLRRFAVEGRGTLAPWDPPRRLVVRGAYRFVRNPMISGVLLVLVGEALVLQSSPHAVWAAVFLTANLIYIPLVEEPQLESRFGESYREYCRHVPRLLPRLRPWQPTRGA